MQTTFASPSVPANPTYAYINSFVDELQRSGVHHAIICPGSRSTPLAMVLADQQNIRCWMHIDERSAAFFALGMARRSGQPVVLICTSGTAAANFLPAIVEAKLSHVPLLIVTSDRPHELRDCGAPQAINQNQLYGTHVKWFVEMALPEASNAALRYIRTIANRAVALTQASPRGPVHLNFPFREPLTPEPTAEHAMPPPLQRDTIAWHGRPNNITYVSVNDAPLASIPAATLTRLAQLIETAPHGLIVVGPQDNQTLTGPIIRMAERLNYPILADPLSQMRYGDHHHCRIISSYDAFLRSNEFVENTMPQLILRFGAMPTSKPLLLYMKHYAACPCIVIDEQGGWEEPTHLASELVHADGVAFCQNLLASLENHLIEAKHQPDTYRTWLTRWQRADQITRQTLAHEIQCFEQPFEGKIFIELLQLLPNRATLYIGNSMPIRDMDTLLWCNTRSIHALGNRGANGIDGVVSSALGASAVVEKKEPTILVIGDLSFFHDLNGLLAAHLHQLHLVVILVNNNGGGIFSFLPQTAYPEHFEQLFGTPINIDFRPVVQMYGGNFQRAGTWEEFRKHVACGVNTDGLHVIEVTTQRENNVVMHRQLWQAVECALSRDKQLEA